MSLYNTNAGAYYQMYPPITNTNTWTTPVIDNISNEENFRYLNNRLDKIEQRLCILHDNPELHEQFQALKEAYENYKIIEKLILGKTNDLSGA